MSLTFWSSFVVGWGGWAREAGTTFQIGVLTRETVHIVASNSAVPKCGCSKLRTRRIGANPEKSDLVNFRGPGPKKI